MPGNRRFAQTTQPHTCLAMNPAPVPTADLLAHHRNALNVLGALEAGPSAVGRLMTLAPDAGRRFGEGNWHQHHRGQFLGAEDGMLHVRTPHGTWLVPPRRAVWVPPGVPHAAGGRGITRSWNIYLTPTLGERLPRHACVVPVGGLMHEVVQRVATWTPDRELDTAQRRLVDVLVDEIRSSPRDGMSLRMPADHRLARIAMASLEDLGSDRTLGQWADAGGLSERSLSRLFRKELGMSFAEWRREAGLLYAVTRLAAGDSVGSVSDALGYASPSNFISMYRRRFGVSPGKYFAGSVIDH